MKRLALSLACLCLVSMAARAQNWPQFRGAGATGVAEGKPAPVKWDGEKSVGVRWKTPIPGLAHSSPVVWGNTVFVTTAVSSAAKDETRFGLYGDVEPVKDDPAHTWKLYAVDKATGKILWERTAHKGLPKVKRHPKSTHADSTPATDGRTVVALFGSNGLFAYDMKGKLLWKQDLGVLDAGWFYDPDYQWEHGSSPVIYKNLVIVQADIQKDSFIAAYDLKTGKQVWKTMREGELSGWSTPTVYEGKAAPPAHHQRREGHPRLRPSDRQGAVAARPNVGDHDADALRRARPDLRHQRLRAHPADLRHPARGARATSR